MNRKYFSLTANMLINREPKRASVCYPLTASVAAAVYRLAEEGRARIYDEPVRFVSGAAIPLSRKPAPREPVARPEPAPSPAEAKSREDIGVVDIVDVLNAGPADGSEPDPSRAEAPAEEPATAEGSETVEEPATVEEPVAEDAPAEEPTTVEEPAAVEGLATVGEPAPVEEPAAVEADKPTPKKKSSRRSE